MTIESHADFEPESGRTRSAELEQFTRDYFQTLGASTRAAPADQSDLLHVSLTKELAAHFEKKELALHFHHSRHSQGELIAHGSAGFDRMLTYLDQDCALTVLHLPAKFTAGEELLKAVQPFNVSISGLKMGMQTQLLIAFNWRLTYRADDKREEIYTVLLDEEGHFIPLSAAGDAPEAGAVDIHAYYADAENATETRDTETREAENGREFKLPPMTQLTRLAERARRYAIYHADLQCSIHEAEILPRLHKSLARLTTYYEQQISEVYDSHDPDGVKRGMLETDLQRKLDEEIENHRLHVQIKLFSCALLVAPVAVADMTVRDSMNHVDIRILRNCYDGSLRRPDCYACGEAVDQIALDREGHITCSRCLLRCRSCDEMVCAQCGIATCPVCKQDNCTSCSSECWACGEAACLEHIEPCAVCNDAICQECRATCSACGINQCRSHLRLDCVTRIDAVEQLICVTCAVRCPGCQQYSAQLATCQSSGQRFCMNCTIVCHDCGKIAGPGYYQIHPVTGTASCLGCLDHCAQCGEATPMAVACSTCATECCIHCAAHCEACGVTLCRLHALEAPGCGHVVCAQHLSACGIGHEAVCLACSAVCTICERAYCADHCARCERCRVEVCSECVRLSGLCDTCALIDRTGEVVSLLEERCIEDERVALLQPDYRWMKAESSRHIIYLGRTVQMRAAIVVVEKQTAAHRVTLARKLGVLDSPFHARWFA